MGGTLLWLILLLLAVTIFALSNTTLVTVMFWQWPIYTGSLALAIVGAGILGALLVFLPSLVRQGYLGSRIRELERRLQPHEEAQGPAAPPAAGSGYPPGQSPSDQAEDTRQIP